MKKELAEDLLNKATFVFAKTMPKNPHWYTLKTKWEDEKVFNEVVMFIRDNGNIEYYFGKPYICYYFDGFKYWTMGNSLEITKLINKAKISTHK